MPAPNLAQLSDNPEPAPMGAVSGGSFGEILESLIQKFATPGTVAHTTREVLVGMGICTVPLCNQISSNYTEMNPRGVSFDSLTEMTYHPELADEAVDVFSRLRALVGSKLIRKQIISSLWQWGNFHGAV